MTIANDLAGQFMPFSAALWDLLHGSSHGDASFTWNVGLGHPFLPDYAAYPTSCGDCGRAPARRWLALGAGDAGGDPRSGTSFLTESGSSLDLRVRDTDPSSSGASAVGSMAYRLSKGADGKPTWQQIAKSST